MSTSGTPSASGNRRDRSDAQGFLELIIRFSASVPDLHLSLEPDPNATAASLKQLIRAALPTDLRNRRIRLIHAGKALTDETLLDTAIKRPRHVQTYDTATSDQSSNSPGVSAGGKGKEPLRPLSEQARIYIHCSIGDVVLSPAELAAEAGFTHRKTVGNSGNPPSPADNTSNNDGINSTSTTPAPRGFDRLLSAGFAPAEVQNLRLQFMAIQAHTHTPDTMPSPNTLRNMEDRWLDNGNNSNLQASNGTGAITAGDDGSAGALDDMLWGAAMGFFWPVGCLFWGFRESGIWTQRRKMAIVVGVVLNVGIGLIRYTS